LEDKFSGEGHYKYHSQFNSKTYVKPEMESNTLLIEPNARAIGDAIQTAIQPVNGIINAHAAQ